jgi:hypothetical protein
MASAPTTSARQPTLPNGNTQRSSHITPTRPSSAPLVAGSAPDAPEILGTAHLRAGQGQFSAQPHRAAAQITHSGVPIIDVQRIAIAVQNGGYTHSLGLLYHSAVTGI